MIAALVLGGILAATVAVASLLAISADSPAVAVVGTAAWWILCGLLAPIRLTLVTDSVYGTERFYGFPFPYAIEPRMTETDLVLSLVPWVVTALVAIPVTSWRFSRGIATGWDRLGTSWPGWRYLWVPLLVAVAAGWGWLEAIGGWDRYDHGYRGVDATTPRRRRDRPAASTRPTTTASTVLSRKQQRHAKRRANSSASVASDAPTERDFGEIEFRDLLDQPDAIPEEGEELDLERLRIAPEDSEALDAEFFGA